MRTKLQSLITEKPVTITTTTTTTTNFIEKNLNN